MLKLKIDSREQQPLSFRKGVFGEIVTEGLPFGDYWAEQNGKEFPVVFERKSVPDLFGTLGKGHKRFKREIERAKDADCKLILIVEASMKDVFEGVKYSSIPGSQILATVFTMYVRYDLTPIFCVGRREAARYIEETFSALGRNYEVKRG